jgi:hypothetical protein
MKTILFAMLLVAAVSVAAQDRACPPKDSSAAEKAIDRVVGWDQLYKAYKDYRHCDTGPVDEVFTEALMRCIVEWKHVEALAKLMDSDKEYREFIFRHLGSPAAKGDVESIYSRAKMNCPKGLDAFCGQILSAVKPLAGIDVSTPSLLPPMAPMPGSAPPKK